MWYHSILPVIKKYSELVWVSEILKKMRAWFKNSSVSPQKDSNSLKQMFVLLDLCTRKKACASFSFPTILLLFWLNEENKLFPVVQSVGWMSYIGWEPYMLLVIHLPCGIYCFVPTFNVCNVALLIIVMASLNLN